MYTKTLLVAGLATLAMASPEAVEKRQQSLEIMSGRLASIASLANVQTTDPVVVSSLVSAASRIFAAVTNVDPSVISVLETALPETALDVPLDEATRTETPSWFTALPTDVQSAVLAQASTLSSLVSSFGFTHTSALAGATARRTTTPTTRQTTAAVGPLVTGGAGSSNGTIGGGRNSTVSSGTLTTSTTTNGSGSTNGGAAAGGNADGQSTSRTSNPGVKPTGAMAASLVGLVGVLGVAVAL